MKTGNFIRRGYAWGALALCHLWPLAPMPAQAQPALETSPMTAAETPVGIGASILILKDHPEKELMIPDGISRASLFVVAVADTGPGARAGLKAGDFIVEIDGQPTIDKEEGVLLPLLRGPKGSQVKLKIQRPFVEDPSKPLTFQTLDVVITREPLDTVAMNKALRQASNAGGGFNHMASRRRDQPNAELSFFILETAAQGAAARAGLKAGDSLLEVNGRKAATMTPEEVGSVVMGQLGSPLVLKIGRKVQAGPGQPVTLKTFDVTLIRDLQFVDGSYDKKADAKQQLQTAIVAARRDGKHIFVDLGTNRSPQARIMHEVYSRTPEIAAELEKHYVVVRMEVSGSNRTFAASLGLVGTTSPQLSVLDAEGKVLAHQDATFFLSETGYYDAAKILAFLEQSKP
jgi:membrane-associated protease RseP (regulator of RpoE activity)